MLKTYIVRLSQEERQSLQDLVSTGKAAAYKIKHWLDNDYPDSEKVILICDQLNTHKLASLYQAFEPSIARSLVERLFIHHTPKHGSWLNIAENELSAMTRQCLDRRIPDLETWKQETTAWYIQRNHSQKSVDWQFTTADARIRLKRLYPQIENWQTTRLLAKLENYTLSILKTWVLL